MKRSIYFFITLAVCSTQLFAMEGHHDPLVNDEEGAPGTHEISQITIRRRGSRSAEKVSIPTKYLQSGFWNSLSENAQLEFETLLESGCWDDLDLEKNALLITMLKNGMWEKLDHKRRNLFINRWDREIFCRSVMRDGRSFQDYGKMLDEVLPLITSTVVNELCWDNAKAKCLEALRWANVKNKCVRGLHWFEQRIFALRGATQARLEDVKSGLIKIREMDLNDYGSLVFIKNYLDPIVESARESALGLHDKLVWELSEFLVLVQHEIGEYETDDESRGLNEVMMQHIITSFDDVITPIIDELLQDLEPRYAKKVKALMFFGGATVLCGVQYGSHYCLGTPILVDPIEFVSSFIASGTNQG